MNQRDLRTSFVAAFAVESCVGLLFTVLNPRFDLTFDVIGLFHFIPLFLLGFAELITEGAFTTGGRLFYLLLFTLQVLVLTVVIYGVVKLSRPVIPKRDCER